MPDRTPQAQLLDDQSSMVMQPFTIRPHHPRHHTQLHRNTMHVLPIHRLRERILQRVDQQGARLHVRTPLRPPVTTATQVPVLGMRDLVSQDATPLDGGETHVQQDEVLRRRIESLVVAGQGVVDHARPTRRFAYQFILGRRGSFVLCVVAVSFSQYRAWAVQTRPRH